MERRSCRDRHEVFSLIRPRRGDAHRGEDARTAIRRLLAAHGPLTGDRGSVGLFRRIERLRFRPSQKTRFLHQKQLRMREMGARSFSWRMKARTVIEIS